MIIRVDKDSVIELTEVYNNVKISTDIGDFYICQRDGGIEIVHKDELVYSKRIESIYHSSVNAR